MNYEILKPIFLFLLDSTGENSQILAFLMLYGMVVIHNIYFANLQQITHCVEKQFDLWKRSNDTLRKLCSIV
jgi:hypothetical protein